MIDYTGHLTRLMEDVVARVPALAFIDMTRVLVFARPGRSSADGAFATCHCLSLPPSEPGYYYWRDRRTRRITRRSEWFVAKSPVVTIGEREMRYLISFTLPRFCDQSFDRSRKERHYHGVGEAWMAKLDTVVHELYHIDPSQTGIRKIARADGSSSTKAHSPRFFSDVAALVRAYLDTRPDPHVYEFLRLGFHELRARYGGVEGTSFRSYPSYPQRYIERLAEQPPCELDRPGIVIEPLGVQTGRSHYTDADVHVRQFDQARSRRVRGRAAKPAA